MESRRRCSPRARERGLVRDARNASRWPKATDKALESLIAAGQGELLALLSRCEHLVSLRLQRMRGLGRAGLAGALARVGTNLVQLELRQFAVDGEFGDALLAATYPRLADLHLDEEMVSEQGIRHLIDATVTPALERLSLDSLAMISGSSWPSALLRRSTESAATARGAWLRCSVCCAKIRAESRGRGCTWVGRSTDWCAARLFWVRCCEGSLILGEGSLPPSLVGFSCRSDGRGHGPLLQPLRSIDIAPDVTDLRELARLDLEERRAC
ncbi:MAG TPA: hypothetical protein VK427_12200, partial [Kofleriaceae bacterium]|nr:hypothetical protein [Kofleriaceae bacterium]